MIVLNNFPLPPSQNKALMPIAGKWTTGKNGRLYQKGRWVKTDCHRKFMNDCMVWGAYNNRSVQQMKTLVMGWDRDSRARGRHFALRVECYFLFHVEQLLTRDNKLKQIDADNRLKPCLDAVSRILDLDDSYFFASSCEKVFIPSKELKECSVIRISPMIPRTIQEIQNQILKPASL